MEEYGREARRREERKKEREGRGGGGEGKGRGGGGGGLRALSSTITCAASNAASRTIRSSILAPVKKPPPVVEKISPVGVTGYLVACLLVSVLFSGYPVHREAWCFPG